MTARLSMVLLLAAPLLLPAAADNEADDAASAAAACSLLQHGFKTHHSSGAGAVEELLRHLPIHHEGTAPTPLSAAQTEVGYVLVRAARQQQGISTAGLVCLIVMLVLLLAMVGVILSMRGQSERGARLQRPPRAGWFRARTPEDAPEAGCAPSRRPRPSDHISYEEASCRQSGVADSNCRPGSGVMEANCRPGGVADQINLKWNATAGRERRASKMVHWDVRHAAQNQRDDEEEAHFAGLRYSNYSSASSDGKPRTST